MKRCGDFVYLRRPDRLYVYDSLWTTFRPVRRVVWNAETRQVEPFFGDLCANCLDPYYGFGDAQTEDICTELTDKYIDDIDSAEELSAEALWKWSHETLVWVRDRGLSLLPCEDPLTMWRSQAVRRKTFRKAPRSFDWRSTKRKTK